MEHPEPAVTGQNATANDLPSKHGASSEEMIDGLRRMAGWYLRAVEEAPLPMSVHADDGEVLLYNRSWTEYSGYTLADIPTVRDWTEKAYGSEKGQRARDSISKLYNSPVRVDEGRSAIRTKGEERRIWNFSSAPIGELPDGRRLVVSMARDVTEQCVAENALQREKEALEATQKELLRKQDERESLLRIVAEGKREWERSMDCIGDLVVLIATEGKVRRCNRPFQQFIGRPFQEILNSNAANLFQENGIPADPLAAKDCEFMHEPTGRWFLLRSFSFVEAHTDLEAPGNNVRDGFVITLQDVTEQKRILDEIADGNARLKEANEQLKLSQARIVQQEKMASIGQLAAGVAHEINNPIGFITSNLGTLRKYAERLTKFIDVQAEAIASDGGKAETVRAARADLRIDRTREDILDTIAESLEGTERVRRIVQDLKSFSHVDQAEVKETDINECLNSTINIAWNEIKYKATLKRELGTLPPVRCNPQQMNQVFMNLLVNAAQAIESQGEIVVRSQAVDGFARISVTDTGCGIPPEILDRLFEPFFTTKEIGKGTGLGLSIAYDIVKKHHGEITVESEVGKGTTFTVRIPMAGTE